MHFLSQILPINGLYCSAQAFSKGYHHEFHSTIEALVAHIEERDAAGHTMYVAQASFRTSESRRTENALNVRNFWFDVDCGEEKFAKTPDKAYLTQADGCAAIKQFAVDLKLPLPSVINSGNGLYAAWAIEEDIPVDKWRVLASILKQVATKFGFKQDPSRTSDASSVLRPAGSTNRKNGLAKPVRLMYQAASLPLKTFTDALEVAAKHHKVAALQLAPPTKFVGLNDEFTTGIEGPPSSLFQIADRCAQIKLVRDTKGNVDEPLWYNFLGMARHTEEGKEVVILHDWSSGHPDYDPAVTFQKIQQWERGGLGPTTCAKFGADSPSGCLACKYANNIISPITLGRPDPVSIATPEEEQVAPVGFKRDEYGLHYEFDGVWKRFYGYDVVVTNLAFDQTCGHEVATIRHQLPVTKEYATFAIRSSLVHDPKALLMTLADNHIQTLGGDTRKQMLNYLDHAMDKLRANRRLSNLHAQMGWKDENGDYVFILGNQLFRRGEEPENIGFARNVPDAGRAFKTEGSIDEWVATTKHLGAPGMEPFAFAFLAGAFGAPLVKFTGYAGAMVALIGDSGIGKTLLGEWIMSVYGDSQKLILLKDDTRNFLVQRLGLYGTLPLYVDEISNIEGQELSDLVYKITQGRDKGRLTRSGTERALINSWSTVAVVSSNHSLTDKLSALKTDASAEMNRVMELDAHSVSSFDRQTATGVYRTFRNNFGGVGARYIGYLVDTQTNHREKIDAVVRAMDLATNAQPEERYWSAIAGAAIYGGLLASKLGLIDFPVAPVLKWIKEHIVKARAAKSEQVTNYTDMLGQFLDAHFLGTMVTSNNIKHKELATVLREPRMALVCRMNIDTERMYISRTAIKAYLEKTYGSYTRLRGELEKCGALLDTNKRKVLGSNTYFGGSQQPVWEIDLGCRALGRRTLSVVKSLEEVRNLSGGMR